MSEQQPLSVDKFVGITLVVLAFLFLGPCISKRSFEGLPIDPEVVLETGRETLVEQQPTATIVEDETRTIIESDGIVYLYIAKYRLAGETKIRTFIAGRDQE